MDASETNNVFDKYLDDISVSPVLCMKKSAIVFSEGVKFSYNDSI